MFHNRFVLASGLLVLALGIQIDALDSGAPHTVPLNAIYASFDQDDLNSCNDVVAKADLGDPLDALRDGPARIVLCVGSDIAAAVKSSEKTLFTPEEPMPIIVSEKSASIWVAAYFGMDGSSPPAFRVRAVDITGQVIRVTFERMESSQRSCDLRAYMVWAPLGHLEAGVYSLELFDAATSETTATSIWRVTEPIEIADR